MVRHCCLPGCSSTSSNKPLHHVPAKKFYSGPKHEWAVALEKCIRSYRKDEWLDRLYQRDDLWICQDHFLLSDFEKYRSKTKLKIGAIPTLNLPTKSIPRLSTTERPPPTDRKLPDKTYHQNFEDLKKSVERYLPKKWEFKETNDYLLVYSSVEQLGAFPTLSLKIGNSMLAHAGYCGWFTNSSSAIKSIDVRKMTVASMLNALSRFPVCGGISDSSADYKDFPSDSITFHNQLLYNHTYDMDTTPNPPALQLIAARSKDCEIFLTVGEKCKSCIALEKSVKVTRSNKESYRRRVATKPLLRKRSTCLNTRIFATIESQQQHIQELKETVKKLLDDGDAQVSIDSDISEPLPKRKKKGKSSEQSTS